MRRFRYNTGAYISALLLLIGYALVAQATTPVTRSQMESFVFAIIGSAALVVFSAFWVLVVWVNNGTKKALDESIGRLSVAVDKLIDKMDKEQLRQNRRLDQMEIDLHSLLQEHCYLHGRVLRRRSGDAKDLDIEGLRDC